MHTFFRNTFFMLVLLLAQAAAASVAIDNVRVYRAPEYTRFVFDVSEPALYQVLPDAAPGRVIIDVRNAALKAKLETVDLKDSPVRRVRSGIQADGTTRIVLDLAVAVRVNSFALQPNELYGHRLVVDLYDLVPADGGDANAVPATATVAVAGPASAAQASAAPVSAAPATVVAVAPAPAPQPATTTVTPAPSPAATASVAPVAAAPAIAAPVVAVAPVAEVKPATPAAPAQTAAAAPAASNPLPATIAAPVPAVAQASAPSASPASGKPVAATRPPLLVDARPVIIAIDAGHGGEDPGARGPGGTREKDVVLAIARAVRDRVAAEPGMKAVLIRDGDYYVGLKDRRTKARKKHDADLFVSIHADAFTRKDARGASVFAVSRRGATSTMAAYLASSENRADLVGGIDPRTDNDLISVISDMMMEGTMRESLQLGRGVLDELGDFARLHKRGVEQAGFMVLKEPNMPSILVETGFISNPEEERLLNSVAYQQKLAAAIVRGLRRYFERSPPPGTWFAANREHHAGERTAKVERAKSEPANSDPLLALLDSKAEAQATAAGPADKPASEKSAKPVKKAAARKAEEKQAVSFVRHKVGKGQSLGWLAQKYGVSQSEIKLANNLTRNDIRIGETLKIPSK